MHKKIYCFFLSVLVSGFCTAGTDKKLEELKSRTLLVELVDDSVSFISEDTLTSDHINAAVKNTIKKYWHFNEKILFCKEEEIVKRVLENERSYLILRKDVNYQGCGRISQGDYEVHPVYSIALFKGEELKKDHKKNKDYVAFFQLLNDAMEREKVIAYHESNRDLNVKHHSNESYKKPATLYEYVFGIMMVYENLEGLLKGEDYAIYDEVHKKKISAAGKTLLIKESALYPNFNEEIIKKHSPVKYEIVSRKIFNQRLSELPENYIFLYEEEGAGAACNTWPGIIYFLLESSTGKVIGMLPETTYRSRIVERIDEDKFKDLISHLSN